MLNPERAVLAKLFPETFARERWQLHRPLKIGIDRDLVELGVLGGEEVHAVLSLYTRRYQYQVALARGGPRFDLDGQVCGEVSPEQMDGAALNVARTDAIAAERMREAVAQFRAARAERAKERTSSIAPPRQRLGLADLRRLGRERKEALAQ